MCNRILNVASYVLCCVGAINWGLVAFLKFNLVEFVFGRRLFPSLHLNLVVYALVGLAGIYSLILLFLKSKK